MLWQERCTPKQQVSEAWFKTAALLSPLCLWNAISVLKQRASLQSCGEMEQIEPCGKIASRGACANVMAARPMPGLFIRPTAAPLSQQKTLRIQTRPGLGAPSCSHSGLHAGIVVVIDLSVESVISQPFCPTKNKICHCEQLKTVQSTRSKGEREEQQVFTWRELAVIEG